MPADIITKTVLDVQNDVFATFGDTSGTQINSSDIIRWVNNGQSEVVKRNPELLPTSVLINSVAGQADYPLLANVPNVLTVQTLHYNNIPLRNLSFQEAEMFILNSPSIPDPLNSTPELWYERAGIITLYPAPAASLASGIKIYYQRQPTKVTQTSDSLSLPDFYYNAIVAFCMEQASLLDENPQMAQVYNGKFDQDVTRLANRTQPQSDYYPFIGMVPETEYY